MGVRFDKNLEANGNWDYITNDNNLQQQQQQSVDGDNHNDDNLHQNYRTSCIPVIVRGDILRAKEK